MIVVGTGDSASLRLSFAFFGHFERNGDVTPIDDSHAAP